MKTEYDIFKANGAQPLFLEVARDLVSAKIRVNQLAQDSPAKYFIYCPKTNSIVAEFRPRQADPHPKL
jgi:hypothetical protein